MTITKQDRLDAIKQSHQELVKQLYTQLSAAMQMANTDEDTQEAEARFLKGLKHAQVVYDQAVRLIEAEGEPA